MAPATKKSAPVGDIVGLLPKTKSKWEMPTTVLTVGGGNYVGLAFLIIHVLTWILAMILIGAWGNNELSKINGATDAAKMLGTVYMLFIIGILVMVLSLIHI